MSLFLKNVDKNGALRDCLQNVFLFLKKVDKKASFEGQSTKPRQASVPSTGY